MRNFSCYMWGLPLLDAAWDATIPRVDNSALIFFLQNAHRCQWGDRDSAAQSELRCPSSTSRSHY
ncbi:MAG: hypothetical protein AAFW75_05645 [Cyanobacteria bacterium J06636_16]